jgi:glutathione S-transferase
MIILFQFPRIWDLPNASTFCVKLETYLRLSNIPYKLKEIRDPRCAPKGKLPFIMEGDKKIADSSLIMDYLKQTYGDKLDGQLTFAQKAIAVAVQRLVEEHLYWIVFYSRWVPEDGWQRIKDDYFHHMPAPFKWFIPSIVRKSCIKSVYAQGVGRFTDEERFQLGKADLDAMLTLLGENSFFFGDAPTSLDCSIWGVITNLLNSPVRDKLADYAKAQQKLMDYDVRMRSRFDEAANVRSL